jgi:hypothetical protein
MEVRTLQCVTHWQKEQAQHWALTLLVVFVLALITPTFSVQPAATANSCLSRRII